MSTTFPTRHGPITNRSPASTRSKANGGVENQPEAAAGRQTLNESQVRQLVATGQQIQKEYGAPQDIEWAWANNQIYLLQSRAITSLFPLPEGLAADPLKVLFSFSAVQGLFDPITPYGQDMLCQVFAIGKGCGWSFCLRRGERLVEQAAGWPGGNDRSDSYIPMDGAAAGIDGQTLPRHHCHRGRCRYL